MPPPHFTRHLVLELGPRDDKDNIENIVSNCLHWKPESVRAGSCRDDQVVRLRLSFKTSQAATQAQRILKAKWVVWYDKGEPSPGRFPPHPRRSPGRGRPRSPPRHEPTRHRSRSPRRSCSSRRSRSRSRSPRRLQDRSGLETSSRRIIAPPTDPPPRPESRAPSECHPCAPPQGKDRNPFPVPEGMERPSELRQLEPATPSNFRNCGQVEIQKAGTRLADVNLRHVRGIFPELLSLRPASSLNFEFVRPYTVLPNDPRAALLLVEPCTPNDAETMNAFNEGMLVREKPVAAGLLCEGWAAYLVPFGIEALPDQQPPAMLPGLPYNYMLLACVPGQP